MSDGVMSLEATKPIVRQLRDRIAAAALAGDDEQVDRLVAARRAVVAWDGNGPMPYAAELSEWGVGTPDAADYDPDDDLQAGFDTALVYLNNGRYRAALDAFGDLCARATGRLDKPSEAGYETTALRLAEQLRPHVERAQRHADKQPEDLKGQRVLWGCVLEIDPQDKTANRALHELDEREVAREIDRRVSDIRERLQMVAAAYDYPAILALLGEAEGLAAANQLTARQRELDELMHDVRAGRDQMRHYLGMASTKAQSEDYKRAYILAREYIDQNIPVAIDERGVFATVGQEYDTVDFLRLARANFIDWSRRKALDYQMMAAQQAPAAPERALRTLAEARAFLTDDALTRDDRDLVAEVLWRIAKDEAEIKARLQTPWAADTSPADTPATEGK